MLGLLSSEKAVKTSLVNIINVSLEKVELKIKLELHRRRKDDFCYAENKSVGQNETSEI